MKKVEENILCILGGAALGAVITYGIIELTKPVALQMRARAPYTPSRQIWRVAGARHGPYMLPVTAGRVASRHGLGLAVGARGAITVGPYAGGLVAPKFIPGPLVPKYQHGA